MPRNVKPMGLTAWLLVLCLLISSCANSGLPLSENVPTLTLPPGEMPYVAPIGDAALEYTADATLYLPMHGSTQLVSFTDEVSFLATRPRAESMVRALLAHEGSGTAAPLGGTVRLSLYGVNPVEVSRDVVTVNLAASALQLDRKAYYLACQAITNTLTRLPGIQYVNFLVMDRQIGLDIAGSIPSGTFSRSLGEDIGAVYEQALSQRVGNGENPASKRLSSLVTLYFPLAGMDGFLPEARNISFDSQASPDIIVRLLQELGAGPQQVSNSPALPLLGDLLTQAPILSDAPEGGGKLITLRFAYNLDDMLEALGLTRASCMASLTYTLSAFLPDIAGIRCYIGDELLQNVRLMDGAQQPAILFENGVQQRADYAAFVLDLCTLYFADESMLKLVSVKRAIPYYHITNPRALLLELAKGPLSTDQVKNAQPIMTRSALKDADLLGFSLNGDTLLVNFAHTFGLVGEGMSEQQDRLLAYGIVNTLCSLDRIHRISFFVASDIPADFSGEIYWAGDFYQNMGLVQSAPSP